MEVREEDVTVKFEVGDIVFDRGYNEVGVIVEIKPDPNSRPERVLPPFFNIRNSRGGITNSKMMNCSLNSSHYMRLQLLCKADDVEEYLIRFFEKEYKRR